MKNRAWRRQLLCLIAALLALSCSLTACSAPKLETDAALLRCRPKTLLLDFSGVTFMDSSGVGLALGRYKKTREQNCALILAGLSDRDKRMMKLSGMQKMDMIEFR